MQSDVIGHDRTNGNIRTNGRTRTNGHIQPASSGHVRSPDCSCVRAASSHFRPVFVRCQSKLSCLLEAVVTIPRTQQQADSGLYPTAGQTRDPEPKQAVCGSAQHYPPPNR